MEIVNQTPDLDAMTRADTPAIWSDFRAQVEKFKATAETLVVTHENQLAEMRLARATRLTLKDIRVAIEKRRKELGEEYLRKTKDINAAANELKAMIEPLESRLLDQEKFAERAEQARREKLGKDRVAALTPYIVVNQLFSNITDMTEEQFSGMLADAKILHESKIEAARKAEEERTAKEKAEAEERERIRLENERLKAEAESREKEIAAEREKARAEREAAEKKVAIERAEADRLAKIEREKIEAQARQEREAREKAEAELVRQKQVEADRIAEEERKRTSQAEADRASKEEAELAPDREKLAAFTAQVRALQVPTITSARGREAIGQKIEEFAAWVESASKNLRSKRK